jgi:hypothetical protein
MSIVGGLDIHRKQLTFDYLDTATGQVRRGQVTPADRCPDIGSAGRGRAESVRSDCPWRVW